MWVRPVCKKIETRFFDKLALLTCTSLTRPHFIVCFHLWQNRRHVAYIKLENGSLISMKKKKRCKQLSRTSKNCASLSMPDQKKKQAMKLTPNVQNTTQLCIPPKWKRFNASTFSPYGKWTKLTLMVINWLRETSEVHRSNTKLAMVNMILMVVVKV